MKTTSYSNVASLWDVGMKFSGLERGLKHFVKRIPLDLPSCARTLELGCGTGIVSIALLKRFPTLSIIATDLDQRMLQATEVNIKKSHVPVTNLALGLANINDPSVIKFNNRLLTLQVETFDLVVTSAVLEHLKFENFQKILSLVKKGGYFLNIGMNNDFVGAMYGSIFKFKTIDPEKLLGILKDRGFTESKVLKLNFSEFPTNFTRIAVLGRK